MFKILDKVPLRKQSIDEKEHGRMITKEEFEALPLEDQFKTAFSALEEDNWKDLLSKNNFDLS